MSRSAPSYTKAQQAVLRILARGATNADIAAALRIQVATVKRHVGSIMVKADVTNRVQLAVQYISTLTAEEQVRHFMEFRLEQDMRASEMAPHLYGPTVNVDRHRLTAAARS